MGALPKNVRLLIDSFEEAWNTDTAPDVGAFVREHADASEPALDAATRQILIERLVRIDLEYRWKAWAQQPHTAREFVLEGYARRLPELGSSDTWSDDLITRC